MPVLWSRATMLRLFADKVFLRHRHRITVILKLMVAAYFFWSARSFYILHCSYCVKCRRAGQRKLTTMREGMFLLSGSGAWCEHCTKTWYKKRECRLKERKESISQDAGANRKDVDSSDGLLTADNDNCRGMPPSDPTDIP